MQELKFNCPHCKQPLEAPEEYFGKTIECPSCNGSIQVPMPKPPASIPPKKYIPPPPQNIPSNGEVKTNVKQGALIGAFACLAIGLVLMFFSLWTFIIYSPLFLAAFILSIVAMAQKRIAGGISALLLTLIVPPLLFFTLAAVRSASTQQAVSKAIAQANAEIANTSGIELPTAVEPPTVITPTIPEPIVAPPPEEPVGWRLKTETSPIDDSTTYILRRDAEEEVGTGIFASTPTLLIRHKEGELELYITVGQFLGMDKTLVTCRLGTSPAQDSEWSLSTDGKAIFYPGNVDAFVRQLMANDKMVIRLTPYGESPITTTFILSGLTDAIEPMKALIK